MKKASNHGGRVTERLRKQCRGRYGRSIEARLAGTLAQGPGPVAPSCQMRSLWETLEEKIKRADGCMETLETRDLKDNDRGRAEDEKIAQDLNCDHPVT